MKAISKNGMEQIWTKIVEHIGKAFHSPEIMQSDLKMKSFCSYMEWFNIACIHAQNQSVLYARSKDAWEEYLGTACYVRSGEKSAMALVPMILDNELLFQRAPLFDISQLYRNDKIEKPKSSMHVFLDEYGGIDNVETLIGIENHDWNEILVQIIGMGANIQSSDRIHYIKECMEYMLGLREKIQADGTCCCTSPESMIFLYRNIIDSSTAIQETIRRLARRNAQQTEKHELQENLLKRRERGVRERIKSSGIKIRLMQTAATDMNESKSLFSVETEEFDEEANPYDEKESIYWEVHYDNS